MTTHLITFSDASMERSRNLCVESALRHGVDDALAWEHTDFLQTGVYHCNQELFNNPRGLGFWAWKPQIVSWLMDNKMAEQQFLRNSIRRVREGDVIIYADAGIEFINNVRYIIGRMDQDIFLFGNNWQHVHWCKADVIKAITPDWFERGLPVFNKQVQASVIFFRVSDYSRRFVKEWLDWCLFEGGRLIDDSPSRTPNHPEFCEHRHDQAILTTMAYRDGLRLHWWGARYNMDLPGGGFVYDKLPEYTADDYEPFVHHHRRRNHEWEQVA